MKILQISSAKSFGSWERHFVDLCRGLQNRGHEVFVIIRPTSEWKERLDFLPKQNVFYFSVRNSFGIFNAQKIAKIIREKEIEIVHAHVTKDYFPSSLACRVAQKPKFVLTRHSPSSMKSFQRFSLTNLGKAIAVSEGIKADLQRLFAKEKTVIIPNGFEINDVPAEVRRKSGEEFRFENNIPFDSLFVGTIGDLKEANGQRDFVLAAQIVAERFHDAHFAVIGEDKTPNKSFRRELKRMVKVFGLEKQFLWLNWVADKSKFFNALDVFTMPPHERSFALDIIEAMAHRTAIVATQTVSAKDILQDNETGLIVPTKEPVQLAEAINRLLSDEDLRISIGQKAQMNVREKFNLQKMIEETERVYQSLI